MNIDTICELLMEALNEAGFNESTLFNYRGVIRRFKPFVRKKAFLSTASKLDSPMLTM